MSAAPSPDRVVPLLTELGTVSGHRFTLLSLEDWGEWCDLRFARVDLAGERTLPRRIPPAEAWRVSCDDTALVVEDAVGRGDREMSIGEVRIRPGLPDGPVRLGIEVDVLSGADPLKGHVDIPGRKT